MVLSPFFNLILCVIVYAEKKEWREEALVSAVSPLRSPDLAAKASD